MSKKHSVAPVSAETTKNQNSKRISPGLGAVIGLSAIIGGNLLAQHFKDNDLRPATAAESIVDQEAKKVAQAIEDTLNAGKEYEEAPVATGLSFAVNPEYMEELGVERIYNPLVFGQGKDAVGYIDINQETGVVSVVTVDMSAGEFCDEFGNPITLRIGDSAPGGQFGLVLTEQGEDSRTVATLTDKRGTVVGQAAPYFPPSN